MNNNILSAGGVAKEDLKQAEDKLRERLGGLTRAHAAVRLAKKQEIRRSSDHTAHVPLDCGKEHVDGVIAFGEEAENSGFFQLAFDAYFWAFNASKFSPEQRENLEERMEAIPHSMQRAGDQLGAQRTAIFFIKHVRHHGVKVGEVEGLLSMASAAA